VIVLTLAIGMGAAVGVFAVINATLINELPYPEADRLVVLSTDSGQYFSRPGFRRLKNTPFGLDLPAAVEVLQFVLTSSAMPERVWGRRISTDMIRLLGLTNTNRPIIGRLFDSDLTKGENEVVVSYRSWINRYGGNPAVVGTSVTLDGVTRQVVGVLGPRVDLFLDSEFLLPLDVDGPYGYEERRRTLQVFGRLRPADDASNLEARLMLFFRSLPGSPHGHVEFVQEKLVHGFRTTLLTMWLAALLVLLVCCLNFASMLSTRFWSRRAELALRIRLGATEGRLVRQLVTEGLLVSVAGGSMGVLLAWMTREVFVKALTNDTVTSAAVTFDWRVIGVVGLGCAAIGVYFTLKTARRLSSASISPAGGRPVMPQRRVVSAIQVTAAMMLVATSAALIQSLARLQSFEVGYEVDDAVTVRFDLPADSWANIKAIGQFVGRTQEAISAIPGVRRVSAASALPHSTTSNQFVFFQLEHEPSYVLDEPEPVPLGSPPLPPPPPPPPDAPADERWAVFHRALSFATAPGFFQTMGVPVLLGRDFSESDHASSERVVIINEAFARRYFRNGNPLSKRLRPNPNGEWMTVVGVVGNVRRSSLDDQVRSEFYRPYLQSVGYASFGYPFLSPVNHVAFVVKTQLSPPDVSRAIRSAVFDINRRVTIAELSTLRAELDSGLEERSRLLRLFVALSLLTLVLAAIGVYSVTSYFVRQRLPELGVRAALGATRAQIIWLPLRDSLVALSIGLPIGLLLSIAAAAVLRRVLSDIQPYDWSVLFMAASTLAACVVIAAYAAAKRGAAADPAVHMNS
jgi:ABC-type antimicrobial peptide transport system permease subunit